MEELRTYFTKGLDMHNFPCVCKVKYLGKADEKGKILIRSLDDDITLIVDDNPQDYYPNEFELARECANYVKEWERKCGGKANALIRQQYPCYFQ